MRGPILSFASTRTIFSSGFKLIILDEAEAMTNEAQNALRRGRLSCLPFFLHFSFVPNLLPFPTFVFCLSHRFSPSFTFLPLPLPPHPSFLPSTFLSPSLHHSLLLPWSPLLTVIEKFTENTRFCLICNYLSYIIPALQSRCTRFRFGPLTPEQMLSRVDYVVQQEG